MYATVFFALSLVATAPMEWVSINASYKLSHAPDESGNFTDDRGPEPFSEVNTYYIGELTDSQTAG
jgi:hypothetical protein